MDFYSTDSDLVKIRSDILSLGVDSWSDKHLNARTYIDKVLAFRWYRTVAADNNINYLDVPFDNDKFLNDGEQLNLLSCYKTLSLIYLDLMKDTLEEDGFERHSKLFEKKYYIELSELFSIGLDYDWDSSGTITSGERNQPKKRRLRRT